MATSKVFRRWVLGLSCSVLPLMGCAQGPAPKAKGMFSWFRSAPLSEAEKQRQEQLTATEKLKDPTSLHIRYAEWREQVGDLTDARKSYQFALQENPKALEAKLGLARLDQLSGRTTDAEQAFQEILKSHPGDARALEALGQFYASQKMWTKALPLLEQAADAAPGDLSYRQHFAVALGQSGNMDAALAQFRQAVGEAEAHYNVAYLLYDKGHKDLARGQLRQALALNPQLQQAQALLDELEDETSGRAVVATATKPLAYPPVQRVHQAAAEFAQQPLVQASFPQQGNGYAPQPPHAPSVRVQQPMTQTPAQMQAPQTSAWTPAQPGTQAMQAPAAQYSTASQQSSAAPVPQTTSSALQLNPEPQPAPMWRKHQPAEAAAREAKNLPPASRGTPAQSPGISAAQREQWENQMKAAAHQ